MIRVLRLIARLNIGGPALHVTHLARGLNPDRFETLLVTGPIGADEGDMSDLARDLNWQIIPELGREVSPIVDTVTLIKLLGCIRHFRPHILHTHTAKAGAVGRVAARLARVPMVVHTFHGHTFRGYWGPLASRMVVASEQGLALLTTKLVAVSERVRDDLLEFRIAPPEKIGTIPLGLDLTAFAAGGRLRVDKKSHLSAGADVHPHIPVIGIVGRLVPIKNHILFLEMARNLIRDGISAKFMVVGDGELRGELERSAADLGDRITFTGWRRDMAEVYRGLSVVVNTSLNEGTPVALIEAMAAGVPTVATAVGGVPDVIHNGLERTGWLAPSGDAKALAEAVKMALRDGSVVAARAQTEVLQRFSKERLVGDVEKLYDTLIAKLPTSISKS